MMFVHLSFIAKNYDIRKFTTYQIYLKFYTRSKNALDELHLEYEGYETITYNKSIKCNSQSILKTTILS